MVTAGGRASANAQQQRRGSSSPFFIGALGVALCGLSLASLLVGPARLSIADGLHGLFSDDVNGIIVRELRLPRTMLAGMIGASLGMSGAALQGLFRNPLAEPAVFGAPQSAALGAVLVLHFASAGVLSLFLPVAAITGALFSVLIIAAVARRTRSLASLLLVGLAMSSFAGALTTLAINLAPNPWAVTELVFWLMGSIEDRSLRHVFLAAPFAAVGMALLMLCRRDLRALALGEDTAQTLGVDVNRTTRVVVFGVALSVGACVAVSGAIGFVGLVAAHCVRPFVRHDPARTLLPAALAGAVIVLAADILVRLLPTVAEVKLGVVTALLGVPFFFWIILKKPASAAEMPS